MDPLHQQVDTLHTQVDALHQIIERLDSKTSEILSKLDISNSGASQVSLNDSPGYHSHRSVAGLDPDFDYKDVLIDEGYSNSDRYTGERSLSPDVQIQRLTAQLTAAYNRIAALEEQLLSKRVHY
ncbi:MAG: hypothetical protein EA367_15725 [Leptolyngbya sp. DLM2.Bin15]|nr:MAG: hypothetical protein EA367_15725 [Leptolyngbya sp. DLM2.Bin15]